MKSEPMPIEDLRSKIDATVIIKRIGGYVGFFSFITALPFLGLFVLGNHHLWLLAINLLEKYHVHVLLLFIEYFLELIKLLVWIV